MDKVWEFLGGDPKMKKKKRRWQRELAAAEYRQNVRAQEESFKCAMRDARAARAAKEPTPEQRVHRPALGYMNAYVDNPPTIIPNLTHYDIPTDPRLHSPDYSLDESARALVGHGRFDQSVNPAEIHRALDADIRANGNLFVGKHPLQAQYEWARKEAVEKGERDPGNVGSIVEMPKVEQRLERRLAKGYDSGSMRAEWRAGSDGRLCVRGFDVPKKGAEKVKQRLESRLEKGHDSGSVRAVRRAGDDGSLVVRGFEIPKKGAEAEVDAEGTDAGGGDDDMVSLSSSSSVSSATTAIYVPNGLRRNRSCTFDDRLIRESLEVEGGGSGDGEGGKGGGECERQGNGLGDGEEVTRSAGSSPDPAENIAAYHDRRARYFNIDDAAGIRQYQSLN